ncbi:triose-phosphate isomerase [Salinarimonas ramus]|uniref:Triosephosphate isomerase n=1 Tax=Salinarimonas ramus TaxID=690164 RepID=A0A917Q910_9HYPH|nr:triose-phosphate isomerase [Salinarimonas ramus]GGK35958.1 triosephosphate isomerase [Salinarimonas ramus]
MPQPRPFVAGNWKMNGLSAALAEADAVKEGAAALAGAVDLALCPPATLVHRMAERLAGSAVGVGGQDCHAKATGAHTGDVSAEMLADAGAAYVIVGHSERRADHGESDADVRAKLEAAHRAGLVAIVCVGETKEEREAGRALEIVRGQLDGSLVEGLTAARTVIAYEPVWAIGTGLVPTLDDIAEMHAAVREALAAKAEAAEVAAMRILYGGSVKPSNAAEILAVANVDGALVGGASLKASDFLAIASAAPRR